MSLWSVRLMMWTDLQHGLGMRKLLPLVDLHVSLQNTKARGQWPPEVSTILKLYDMIRNITLRNLWLFTHTNVLFYKLFSSDITTLLPICFVVVVTLVKQTWLKLSVTPTLYSERRLRHSPCSSAADLCRWSSLLRSLFPPGFLETAAQAPDSPAPA